MTHLHTQLLLILTLTFAAPAFSSNTSEPLTPEKEPSATNKEPLVTYKEPLAPNKEPLTTRTDLSADNEKHSEIASKTSATSNKPTTIQNTNASLNSAPPLVLGVYYIQGYIDSVNKGVLIDYYKDIKNTFGWNTTLTLQPAKRIQHEFRRGKLMGYFPELEEHRPPNSCRSATIGYKNIFAFTLKHNPIITNIQQLEGLNIGIVSGYSYGEHITQNPKLNLHPLNNNVLAVKMLVAGRLDVILEEEVATRVIIDSLEATDKVHYSAEAPLSSLETFFVFQTNEAGLKLCAEASQRIKQKTFDFHRLLETN